jgi:hypothetical protein
LRSCGISTFSDREKVIQAFREYEGGSRSGSSASGSRSDDGRGSTPKFSVGQWVKMNDSNHWSGVQHGKKGQIMSITTNGDYDVEFLGGKYATGIAEEVLIFANKPGLLTRMKSAVF